MRQNTLIGGTLLMHLYASQYRSNRLHGKRRHGVEAYSYEAGRVDWTKDLEKKSEKARYEEYSGRRGKKKKKKGKGDVPC
jgi:hypothetical protein